MSVLRGLIIQQFTQRLDEIIAHYPDRLNQDVAIAFHHSGRTVLVISGPGGDLVSDLRDYAKGIKPIELLLPCQATGGKHV